MTGYKRKRGDDAWRLEVTIGTDAQGKPKRYSKTVHCKSSAEADRELAKFYTACEEGRIRKQSSMLVSDLCDSYYEEYAKRFLKTSSLRSINTAIKCWIKPKLGAKKCSKLTRHDVQRFVNGMADNVSPKTVRNYYSALRQIMAYAVDMEIIDDTPCKNVRLPKKDHTEANYYDIENVKKLIVALEATLEDELVYKCAVLVLLFGGLRKGEVLGLNWADIDFADQSIHVHRTRMIGPNIGVYEDTPKTASSVRYVTLPKQVMDTLKQLQIQQKKRQLELGYIGSDAVLQGVLGQPLYPQVLQRWFTRFITRSGLPKITLHGLRHTHASMLAHMNTDKMQISERLGHSELSTTLNIYTHLFENADKKIAEDLQSAYLIAK